MSERSLDSVIKLADSNGCKVTVLYESIDRLFEIKMYNQLETKVFGVTCADPTEFIEQWNEFKSRGNL